MPRRVIYALALSSWMIAAPAFAQSGPINSDLISGYGLRNLENAVTINASPATPDAGDTVHFTVESAIYDLEKSDINWVIDGKTVAQGTGITSADATVDSAGDAMTVYVSVVDELWGSASSELTLVPLQLDLLYDAPTYVPPFYRGRTLATSGGVVRLQAIARFSQDGTPIKDSAITYTWQRNGRVLTDISGLGRSRAVIDAPDFFDTDTISVRASAANNTLSAQASIRIPSVQPVLQIYEDHPLFGITYNSALGAKILPPGEMSVAAVPYFATAISANDPSLRYGWDLNGNALAASSSKKNEVDIPALQGESSLSLTLTHAVNFFLDAIGGWTLSASGPAGSAATQGAKDDAFHSSQP